MTDFNIRNEGTIFILTPLTDDAEAWLDNNISDDATTFGNGIVVEHRYIEAILEGIELDGLSYSS